MIAATAITGNHAVSGINRMWMILLGILMLVLGFIGLGMAYSFTLIALFWFGVLAVIAGVGQFLDGFHHKAWSGAIWHMLVGLVYVAIGAALIFIPASMAYWLALLIALGLAITGLIRLLNIYLLRGFPGPQILSLVGGLISLGLAFYIYQIVAPPDADALATVDGQRAWVRSWGWIIGAFVAIDLIVDGVTLISTGLMAGAKRAD